MRLLIANANTSKQVTTIVAEASREFALPGTELISATAEFGAKIIASRTENAIAQHAILDLVARHADDCDGVLIAASYDCGLRAAREMLGKPVTALTEASLLAALTVGSRVGLVIWGEGAAAVYLEVIDSYGLGGRICGTRRLDMAPPEDADSAARLDSAAAEASRFLVNQHEADVILLLGAVFAGRSPAIEERVEVPVLDGARCGIPLLEAMVRIGATPPLKGSFAMARGRETRGLSSLLSQSLSRTTHGSPG
jgi:allantoin racemase